MNIDKLKQNVQVEMLKDLCKQISELDNDWLEDNTTDLLKSIIYTLEDQSQEDAWGTEGWEHFFGYDN